MDRFHPPGFLADFARRPAMQADYERGWDSVIGYWFELSKPITGGGQIADEVQISLTGLAKKRGDESDRRYPCVSTCCKHPVKAVRTVIEVKDKCSSVDWDEVVPYLQSGPAPAEALLAAIEEDAPVDAGTAPRPYNLLAAKR